MVIAPDKKRCLLAGGVARRGGARPRPEYPDLADGDPEATPESTRLLCPLRRHAEEQLVIFATVERQALRPGAALRLVAEGRREGQADDAVLRGVAALCASQT